jgi:pyridinium-3,5-biscarboxylic acid mononucleotide sulfurtransferase
VDLVVGFDLDMTLVDSRAGIVATLREVAGELGVQLADADIWPTIGIPLDDALRQWLPEELVPQAYATYRRRYPDIGVPTTTRLPGAAEAIAAVRSLGGRVVVVSAKVESAARQVLATVGLAADVVVGDRFAHGKAAVLRELGAQVYVGDHPGDMLAAQGAQAHAVAVATGPTTADELATAGADVVLASLTEFPAWLEEHVLAARLAELDVAFRALSGPVVVAFSGGADSAFALAAAVRALGPQRVTAATAVSPSLATGELDQARTFAAELGVRHVTPETHELDRDGYAANAGNRCYYCKSELVDVLSALDAVVVDGATIVTGTNADDARAGFRPGIRAADERGARAPLRDCGLTKSQVRAASRQWGLRTWDKPAAACLSSRIAYGVPVTRGALDRVDRAEQAVRAELAGAGLAARDIRVRDLGADRARIELDRDLVSRLLGPDGPTADGRGVLRAARKAGFVAAELDPRGFRSGSMNELLPQPELYR